jgi:hypothetical protein
MEQLSVEQLLHASNLLFGRQGAVLSSFLKSMAEEDLKAAFRKKALQTHPDRAAILGRDREEMADIFKEVVSAYEILLQGYADNWAVLGPTWKTPAPRARQPQQPPPPPRQQDPHFHHARYHNARQKGPHYKNARQQEPHHQAPPKNPNAWDRFYTGQMPNRPLLFSEFLYYSGVVSWRPFIESICWQRRQRPRIGELAQNWGLLDQYMISRIIRQRKPLEKFGDCAVRYGYMTQFWLNVLLRCQQKKQQPIGEFFIKMGLMQAQELEVLNQRRLKFNALFK